MELPAWQPPGKSSGPKELGFLAIAATFSAGLALLLLSVITHRALLSSKASRTDSMLRKRNLIKIGTALRLETAADKHSHNPAVISDGQAVPKVQSLHIYPVKSCRGLEIQRSRVLPTGLEFDRLFTFAQREETAGDDGENGPWRFLTQRTAPLLASVQVDLWVPAETRPDNEGGGASIPHGHGHGHGHGSGVGGGGGGGGGARSDGGLLVLRFPWRQQKQQGGLRGMLQGVWARATGVSTPAVEFTVPLAFPTPQAIEARGYAYQRVRVWKDVALALNMASDLPPELHSYLGLKRDARLALFRADPRERREVFRCAPRRADAGFQPVVDFHDAYPLHLLNVSSVRHLEARMGGEDGGLTCLDVRRFRANIIVSGVEEYDEETWRSIAARQAGSRHAESHFDVSCRMVRCQMVNVDQDSGVRHRYEPDRSLRKYRDVDEGAPRLGCLGMCLCPVFPGAGAAGGLESVIEVGMELSVLQRGEHLYIQM